MNTSAAITEPLLDKPSPGVLVLRTFNIFAQVRIGSSGLSALVSTRLGDHATNCHE
jgi:hypothetical protein